MAKNVGQKQRPTLLDAPSLKIDGKYWTLETNIIRQRTK
jgi:hypothetical protein